MVIPTVEIKKVKLFVGQMVKAFCFEENVWIEANIIDIDHKKWKVVFADVDNTDNTWTDTLENICDSSQYRDWEVKK